MSRRSGFSIIEIVIVIAVLAVIGLVGWRAWDAFHSKDQATGNGQTSSQVTNPDNVPAVNSSADLDKMTNILDGTNINGDESTQLDQQTDF